MSERSSSDPKAEQHPGSRIDALLPEVYDELREIARRLLSKERRDHTLQPTEIVHEAFLKLRGRVEVANAVHLKALVARAVRQILIDHARRRARPIHGGHLVRVTLAGANALAEDRRDRLEDVERALAGLAAGTDEGSESADVAVLRYFGGLTDSEIATVKGRSVKWVYLRWAYARAWLKRELARG